ncbi:MAG TPA: DNA primase [Solirubrobacteraceae bacterium]|nr:DNA primase [Solirubrobacteraceae bacterium]
MALYTAESKDRVRDAVDMVDLIGSRTELRRAGVERFTGLCPFHDERTPSFSVSPIKKAYYCFGCGAAGDPISFVRELDGLDFREALEFLADRYNVALETEDEDPAAAARQARSDRLLAVLERTCGYYERYLWESTEARRARSYLLDRGLDEATLRKFRVGYAPSAWDRVLVASRQGGYTEQELYDAGLVQRSQERGRGFYDRFRARIMFPLADQRGRVRGFGARATSGDQTAKYINTADNDVYHKGQYVYGAHLARTAAAKQASVIVCEGYTDVIAMHQAGRANAVGLMGTALTDEQLGALQRMAPTVTLALDADKAGQEAMLRAARLAAKRRLELRVVGLPKGSDPAELLQAGGPDAVRALVERSVPFVRFRVERVLEAGTIGTADGRDRMLAELTPILGEVPAGAMRADLERLVAGRLELPQPTIASLLAGADGRRSGPRPADAPLTRALDVRERAEQAFLALCIALPDAGRQALEDLDVEAIFTGEVNRRAALHLRRNIHSPGAGLDDDAELAALLAELAVRATQAPAHVVQLDVERLQLELSRIDRELAAARAAGNGGLSDLAARRRPVMADLERALVRALEETADRRD